MSLKINHIKRTVIAAAIILAVVFLAVLPAVTIYIYEDYFGFKSSRYRGGRFIPMILPV